LSQLPVASVESNLRLLIS